MRTRTLLFLSLFFLMLFLLACSSKPAEQGSGDTANPATATSTPGTGAAGGTSGTRAGGTAAAAPIRIPEGTAITVQLDNTLSSKGNNAGDSFTGTVMEPVEIGGKVVIPKGATARGTVVEAKPLGKFKGGAALQIALRSVTIDGRETDVKTHAASYALKGKGKRSTVMIGGGAAAGALIGGLIGGGKGAAIGAASGAGAGTAGAAFTGNKDIVLPAETAVTFKLTEAVEVKK